MYPCSAQFCGKRSLRSPVKSGFALVVSLVLMAFILLLMVSLSVCITVEVQASRVTNLQQQARQNALLALNTALAELQRVAGPDQRVTARADILEPRSDIDNANKTVANPYYTAVWDVSWTNDTKPSTWPIKPGTLPHHDRNLKPYFLVSGNEGYEFSTTSAPINEGTTDFKNPIEFSEIDVTVEGVGIFDSNGRRIGDYAWWIGDEGVKAKIALRNPEKVLSRPNPALFSPGANPAMLHSSLLNFDLTQKAEDLANVYFYRDLLNVDSDFGNLFDGQEAKRFESFHDVTLYSMGVLADVRNGGLKKDLSPTFAAGAAIPNEVGDATPLFPVDPTILANWDNPNADVNLKFFTFNPTFGQLRSYYRADNIVNTPPSGVQVVTVPGSEAWENRPIALYRPGTRTQSGVSPVVARAQTAITPFLIQETAEPDEEGRHLYSLYYAFQPIIILWNPYDTAITTPRMLALDWVVTGIGHLEDPSSDTGMSGFGNRFRMYDCFILPDGAEGVGGETAFYDLRLQQMLFELPEVVIPAGRAVVFSPPPYNGHDNYNSKDKSQRIPLEVGYNPTGHFVHQATHMVGAMVVEIGSSEFINTREVNDTPDKIAQVTFWSKPEDLGLIKFTWGRPSSSNNINGFFSSSGNMWDFFELNSSREPVVKSRLINSVRLQVIEFVGNFSSVGNSSTYSNGRYDPLQIDFIHVFGGLDDLKNFQDHRYLRYVAMRFPGESNYGLSANPDKPRMLRDFNMRAEFASAFRTYNNTVNLPGMYVSGFAGSPNPNSGVPAQYQINFAASDTGGIFAAPWGAGIYTNPDQVIFHTLHKDNRSLWNMAELTHANLLSGEIRSIGGGRPRVGYNRAPQFPLGNSYVPVYLEYDMVVTPNENYYADANPSSYSLRGYLHDLSYLINEGLYDRYFLSGAASSVSELNPKLVYTKGDEIDPNDVSFDNTAASFLVDGTFNVNSTSKEAWKAFLAGVRDAAVELLGGEEDGGKGSGTPALRLPNPMAEGMDESDVSSASMVDLSKRYRRLSDAELDVLAEHIVRQVKLRGPFPSMSAFVNRVLANPSVSWSGNSRPVYRSDLTADDRLELVESGALQAALDADGSINDELLKKSAFKANYKMTAGKGAQQSLYGSVAEGVAAFVMQSDLLGQMDSMMNVRSDTFTIVAYGDVVDPLTGEVTATAKCEAVVQRLPDYMVSKTDNSAAGDEANAAPYNGAAEPALQDSLNQKMGRRFVVVAFRWL